MDIPNAKDISDDILVFGKTQEEYDETQRRVFQRLRDLNVTLNREKCLFNRSHITFFGYTFSGDGVPEKVTAMHNAAAPTSATKVRNCSPRHRRAT